MSETIQGLEALQQLLSRESLAGLKRAVLLGAGEVLRGYLAVYPGPPAYPVPWSSEKQRRWFWANVREGKLEVPYRRQQSPTSERLGPSWVVVIESDDQGAVQTSVSYARWVQGAAFQQPMHAQTGWITDAQAVAQAQGSGDLNVVYEQAFHQWVGGMS